NLNHFPFRKTSLNPPNVILQAADNHFIPIFGRYRNSSAKTLRVKYLEQRRETIGMAVMRSRRQKQTMFKSVSNIPNGPCDLRIDRIFLTTGWRGVVGFV